MPAFSSYLPIAKSATTRNATLKALCAMSTGEERVVMTREGLQGLEGENDESAVLRYQTPRVPPISWESDSYVEKR